MNSCLRVLIVEDNPLDAELMVRRLINEGYTVDWQRLENEDEYRAALKTPYDLILSDWSLPDFSGLRALQITRELAIELPFIIVSGSIGEEAAVDALHRGASDYLLKDRPDRLGRAVQNALEKKRLNDQSNLAESLLRLQATALNAAANAIVITHRNGIIEWINPAFTELTGYTFDEAIGETMHNLLSSGMHSPSFYQNLRDISMAGKVWQGEMINRRKDGQIYFEEQTITPVYDSSGQICQFIVIKQDITSRKNAEEKLRQSEERFREVAANAGEWIWEVDTEGLYRYCSPVVEKILGFSADELVGRVHFFDLFAPSVREALKTIVLEKFARKEVFNGFINLNIAKDGREVILETSGAPIFDANGDLVGYRGTDLDITERKHTEQALYNSQEQYRYLVELSPDAIFVNRNNRVDFVNPAALELFGAASPDQILNKTPYDLFHPDFHSIITDRIRSMKDENITVPLIEEKIIRLDGSIRDVEVAATPFTDSKGSAIQVILRDVTERKRAEELLRETSAELSVAYDATLQGWSNALELRERETAGHSNRVVQLTLSLSQTLGFSADELIHIQRGALLHDIGKMGIPDNILLKPGPLSDEEWEIMRKHPVYAYNLLSKIPYLTPALDIPLYHHERWDGSGYPKGLVGEAIPLAARIFAVVDVWDALSYDRPYRLAWTQEAIIAHLKEQVGKQFDPQVVNALLDLI